MGHEYGSVFLSPLSPTASSSSNIHRGVKTETEIRNLVTNHKNKKEERKKE
jgi:hypothetical protein